MWWLLFMLGCGGCSDPEPEDSPPELTAAERATAAKAAMLRVRLHARFVSLTPEGVTVRIDNPTEVDVERAHILVAGRRADGSWQRDTWTGPIAAGEQGVEVLVAVPPDPIGGIRVTMTQAIPAPEPTSELSAP